MLTAAATILALSLYPDRDSLWKTVYEDDEGRTRVAWAEAYLPQPRGRRVVWMLVDQTPEPEVEGSAFYRDDWLWLIEIRCRDRALRVRQAFSIPADGSPPHFDTLPEFNLRTFQSRFSNDELTLYGPVIDDACAAEDRN